MTTTYKRAVFVGPKQIRFDDVPIPEPTPRQALVRVKACALCTWEQRVYTGEEHYYPLAGGHEVSGELVKLGDHVYTDAQIGDRVMASPLTRCGYCESCRRGLDNLCDNNRKPFRETDVPGPAGLAEYILLDDYQLYKANNDTPFEEICLTEPLACVTRSVRRAQVERADNVVVVGAGIMGMLHMVLARQIGARVIVSEPDPQRAAFAREMGANAIIDPTKDTFVDQVKALTSGRGADVIFCAVSIASAVEQAIEAVATGGRVHVYASIHPRGTKISIDPNPFHSKEIMLTGTMSQDKEDVLQAVRLISQGLIDLKPFISLVLPFERLEEGLQAALRPDTYRVIITI
ncbi:MAG: zinc-binding dehydrogenase [Chloroflexota bacterium]|nr:zinc-binding dehydrogenase [Chloroflexota bacterium]